MTADATNARTSPGEPLSVDLSTVIHDGPTGVVWGLDSPQLNVNLVTICAGDSIPEHTNDGLDVVIIVLNGSGHVEIDQTVFDVGADSVTLVPRGTRRSIRSQAGMTYYSIHVRSGGLGLPK